MKNPEKKPLRIVWDYSRAEFSVQQSRVQALSHLAVAESNLVRAGKDSALPHFIAIVKELESVLGFKFEQIEE